MAKIKNLVVDTKRVNYDKKWIVTDTTVAFPYAIDLVCVINRKALNVKVNYHVECFGGDYHNIRLIECEIVSSIDTWGNVQMSKDTVKNLFQCIEDIEKNHYRDFLKNHNV